MSDRRVHAFSSDGLELVRYSRAGKWYIERPGTGQPRQRVTLADAVTVAMEWWSGGGSPNISVPGGSQFDAGLRRACAPDEVNEPMTDEEWEPFAATFAPDEVDASVATATDHDDSEHGRADQVADQHPSPHHSPIVAACAPGEVDEGQGT